MRFLRLTMLFSCIFFAVSSAFAADAIRFNLVGGTYVGAPQSFFMDPNKKMFCLDAGCANRIQQLQANPTNSEFTYLGTVVNGAQIIDRDGKFTTSDRVFYQEWPAIDYNATNLFSSRQQITFSLTGVTGISPNPIIFKPGIGWVDDKDNPFTKLNPLPTMSGKRFLGFSTRSDPKASDSLMVINDSGNMLAVAESLSGSLDLFPVWENDSVICAAGQYLPANQSSCTQCPANSWCPGGSFKTNESTTQGINACAAGLISDAGSSNVEACHTALPDSVICPAGEYLPANRYSCTQCPANSWCPGGNFKTNEINTQGINPCEEGLISDAGSSNIEACRTTPPEVVCPAGEYLPVDSEKCTICLKNNWCPGGNFQIKNAEPQGLNPCEKEYTSEPGSSDIKDCQMPPPETTTCAAGQYLPANSNSCTQCPANSWCAGGTYQINQSANQGITACPNSGISGTGSSAISSCYKTGLVLSVPNGEGTQTCYWGTVGYTSGCFNYSVKSCIAGYYWAGGNPQCDEVGIGYFSPDGDTNRQECPSLANNNLQGTTETTTSADSSSCFIEVPFVSDKNGMGTMRCVFNPETLYGKAETYEKNENKFPIAPLPDDGQCKNLGMNFCFGGFFLENPDNAYCDPVGNGNFSQRPDLIKYIEQDCLTNPAFCANEYGYDLSKPEELLGQTTCPDPYVNSEGQRDSITNCFKNCSVISVANSASVTAVSTKINYGAQDTTCKFNVTCQSGFQPSGSGTATPSCTGIPPETTTCSAGQYLPANSSSCSQCPANSWCPGGTFTTNQTTAQGINTCSAGLISDAGSSSSTACHTPLPDSVICPAGQYLPMNSYSCIQCPANSWCPGGNFKTNEGATQGINPCEEGLISDAGSSNIEACRTTPPEVVCPAGEYLPVDSEKCTICLKNNWCPGGNFQIKNAEPQGLNPCEKEYTSEPGSSDIKDCQMPPPETTTCAAGQYLPANSNSCTQCPANSWCAGGTYQINQSANQGITACPNSGISGTGSSAISSCYKTGLVLSVPNGEGTQTCYWGTVGYTSGCFNYSVKSCIAGYYWAGGNPQCDEVGIGYFSPDGDTNRQECPSLANNNLQGTTETTTSADSSSCFIEVPFVSDKNGMGTMRCVFNPETLYGKAETYEKNENKFPIAPLPDDGQCKNLGMNFCFGGFFLENPDNAYCDPVGNGNFSQRPDLIKYIEQDCLTNPAFCANEYGYDLSKPEELLGQTTCPDPYVNSEGQRDSITNCFKNCSVISVANSASVTAVSTKINYGAQDTTCKFNVTCQSGFQPSGSGTATPSCTGIPPETTTCSAGQYLPANSSSCSQCPANSWCPGGTFTTNQTTAQGINTCSAGLISDAGSSSSTACHTPLPDSVICPAGQYLPMNSYSCIQCPANSWCPGGNFKTNEGATQGINPCEEGLISDAGSSNIEACRTTPPEVVCPAGEYLPVDSEKCTICLKNNWCPGGNFQIKNAEPQGLNPCEKEYTSEPGSSDIKDCQMPPPETTTCAAGQYLPANSNSCTQCPANSWCAGGTYQINQSANQGITACPNSGISGTGSSAISSCYKTGLVLSVPNGEGTQTCYWGTVGYTSGCFNYSVKSCIAGYYWAGGNPQCDEVGIGYFSPDGDTNRQECPSLANNNLQGTTETTTSADSSSCFIEVPFVSDKNGMGTMRCVFNPETLYGKAETYEKNENKFPIAPLPDDGQCKNLGMNFCFGGFFLENPDNAYCDPVGNGNFSQRPDLIKYIEQDCLTNPAFCANEYGYDLSKPEELLGQTTCPDPYVNSEGQRDSITNCFKNCSVISVANSASVTAVSTKINYGAQDTTCKFNVTCQSGFQPSGSGTATPSCTGIPPETTTCSAGQYLPANSNSCTQCPVNSWCAGGTYQINQSTNQGITACGAGLISDAGSSSSSACHTNTTTCAAGQYLPANSGSCTQCTANSWCAGGTYQINQSANQGITACDTGLISDAGSSSSSACHSTTPTCAAGEYLPANTDSCIQCPANSWCAGGTYEIQSIDQGIIACSSGWFSEPGSSNPDNCQKTCAAGEYLHFNGDCNICFINYWCPGGTFSPNLTHQGTIPCGNGLVSDVGSSSIEACHIPPTTATCAAGQYVMANTSSCSQCLANNWCPGGTYQTNQSTNQGITACGGAWLSDPGSSSIDDCKPRTITCTPGQYMAADTYYCLQCPWNSWCPGGTYQMYQSTDQGINDCGAAWYSTIGSSSIEDCLPRTIPCNPGQYLPANSGFCTQCTANSWCGGGTYQTYQSTNQGITACDTGLISNAGSSSSTACKTPAAETTTCAAGQYLPANSGSCTQCPANSWCAGGTYQTYQSTNQGITACDTGLISNAGSSSSTACKTPAAETTTCAAGQYLPANSGSCTQCPANSWCAGGTYQINQSSAQGITACDTGLISNAGSSSSTACKTPAAETTTCAAGQYLPANQSSCTQCTANSWCAGGTYQINQSSAQGITACGSGLISEAGSSSSTACQTPAPETTTCTAGQYLPANQSSCTQCPANSWCAGGTYQINQSTNQGITACGAGLISDAGSSSSSACHTPAPTTATCAAGQYLPANTLTCTTCVAGNYCTGGTFSQSNSIQGLAACPYDGNSAAQSTSSAGCYKACSSTGMNIPNSTSITPVTDKVYWTSNAYPACAFTIACSTGYHLESSSTSSACVLDEVVCNTDPNASAFNANCEPTKCKFGYHLENKQCISNRMPCPITNGTGVKEWMSDNISGGKWTQCTADSCEAGYTSDRSLTNEKKPCGICRNMRNASGEIVVSSWKNTNCEISTCMYQGERYRLSNNECIPICDTNEDDTGTMRWDSISKKCERTCKPGFTSW